MFQKKASGLREAIAAAVIFGALGATPAMAQTAFGSSKTIVFPLLANTQTFTTTVTLYNPNASDVTVGLDYFDANNTAPPTVPGPKPCSDVLVPATGSVAFTLSSQCTLEAGSHFGPLIVSDNAGVAQIFGYSRTENNASAGFSIEGFPSENFATDTTNVTGLQGSTIAAPPPARTSNCFVTAQADAITYDMNLFDGTTGAQIGSTVSGALNPFEQIRYLDVFSPTVANAPAATDFSNVRAEFTRTSAGTQQMVAFCTVQDNATFGADFRIAKAVTPPPPPPPPPPVGELVLAGTWNGTISSLLVGSPRAFAGTSTAVVLASAGSISAYGGGWFARNSSGGAGSLSLGVCYQDQSGPGPITVMGSTTTYSVSGSQTWHYAAGTAALPAGTYNVGLCAQNIGSNSLNKNGNTSGFAFVGS
jgi:hypothetical protein